MMSCPSAEPFRKVVGQIPWRALVTAADHTHENNLRAFLRHQEAQQTAEKFQPQASLVVYDLGLPDLCSLTRDGVPRGGGTGFHIGARVQQHSAVDSPGDARSL